MKLRWQGAERVQTIVKRHLRDLATRHLTRPPCVIGVAALMVLAAEGDARAFDATGTWMTQKRTAAVELAPCGDALCGRVVWLADPTGPDGDIKRDAANPDPDLRDRPWCAATVITGLRSVGSDRWEGGRFYYFKHGRSYDLSAERDGAALRLRAFLGLKALGRTEVWERADPDLVPCPQASGAS